MSILGAVIRVQPAHLTPVTSRLASLPGVDIALNPGDGRLVLVMEDVVNQADAMRVRLVTSAAATLAAIATWPDVLSTSLVYEYSGPDAPPLVTDDMSDFRAWRGAPARTDRTLTAATDTSALQANNTENIA